MKTCFLLFLAARTQWVVKPLHYSKMSIDGVISCKEIIVPLLFLTLFARLGLCWLRGSKTSLSLRTQINTKCTWRQNGFTYRKKWSCLVLTRWIIYVPNAENRAKVCQGTAEILWCIWCEYKYGDARLTTLPSSSVNPLWCKDNYSATSNDMKLVHWPLMGGLLHLVQRGEDWAGPEPAQAPPRCTKCNSPPINGQCTSHRITV